MKGVTARWIGSVVLWVAAGWCGAGEAIALSDEVQLEPIEDGAWLVVHRFAGGNNSLLVQCDATRFVWVDTPCTDDATRLVSDQGLVRVRLSLDGGSGGGCYHVGVGFEGER